MSLVAYAASSDEESDNEDDVQEPVTMKLIPADTKRQPAQLFITNGHISDEEDEYMPDNKTDALSTSGIGLLHLPKPKNAASTKLNSLTEINEIITPALAKLPMPKTTHKSKQIVEEEDDEFLHKKATVPTDFDIKKPPPIKMPVKITIPSMKDFADVDEELAKSGKSKIMQTNDASLKKSGLLSILPQAKSEQNFAKIGKQQATKTEENSKPVLKSNSLVPDTVRNRRPAHNTEGVDGVQKSSASKKIPTRKKKQPQVSLVACSDSENSDDEVGDFFSLNNEEKLPEVNTNEINVMVAKRAAKMAETTTKYLETTTTISSNENDGIEHNEEELRLAQKRYHEKQLNDKAIQALVGSSSKRRRKQNDIEIVDISSHQVLPDREEWMRTALASQTAYQPTGVLVDEEPASGTRRKHQITYLAHKAKANEAELQAMWSANRSNRRATQSKYGF